MIFTRGEMKAKAIEVLETLQVPKNFIDDYEKSDIVPYFSHSMEGYEDFARNFLEKNKTEILDRYGECFAISLDVINGNLMLSLICYSKWREDSEHMFTALDFFNFRVYAYVYNITNPKLSEYGSIVITPHIHGIARVG